MEEEDCPVSAKEWEREGEPCLRKREGPLKEHS
jgi:hypothetical protein